MPFLHSPSLVLEAFILLIIIPLSWIIPVPRSGRWMPAGHDCRHRWVSRPVMASICHCALAGLWFLYCFSFCLSSLSLFFSWKCPIGTKRRCHKGSNVIPINRFQHGEGVQSQLEVYILLDGYWKVECYKVKMNIFYCQKANGRSFVCYGVCRGPTGGLRIDPKARFPTIILSPINCHEPKNS